MPEQDWEKFERCAVKLDDLHYELRAAEANRNFDLAKTIGCRIKDAESTRDRLLCRIGHSFSAAA